MPKYIDSTVDDCTFTNSLDIKKHDVMLSELEELSPVGQSTRYVTKKAIDPFASSK